MPSKVSLFLPLQMHDTAARLGAALQVGENLLWKEGAQKPQKDLPPVQPPVAPPMPPVAPPMPPPPTQADQNDNEVVEHPPPAPPSYDLPRPTTVSQIGIPDRDEMATPIMAPYDPYEEDHPSRMSMTSPHPPPRGLTELSYR